MSVKNVSSVYFYSVTCIEIVFPISQLASLNINKNHK